MSGLTQGYIRTYRSIFEDLEGDGPAISSIQIPKIQRDYAQGREDATTAAIRREFLDVLIRALTTLEPEGLDFVYGEVTPDGVLKPLDGQQRLTTLFLLHWYVASRAGALDPSEPWTRFRYATRLSAEYFCRELVTPRWPHEDTDPREWITDQPWYLFPWRTDPTIQSMLVMISAIHERLTQEPHDFAALWERLTSSEGRAISFLFLPIEDMESGDDLYIKMNSRGKPLTDFEIFKARLEKVLEASGRRAELSAKFDRQWSDLLWHYEGGDYLVDNEFMRYLAFVVDVCEWRSAVPRGDDGLLERARRVFAEHADRDAHLDFLFFAFDTWVGETARDDVPAAVFSELLTVSSEPGPGLHLFESQKANLFEACLESYGTKQFSLAETILLYAVLIVRQSCPTGSEELLARRLRSLRNIAESAPDEVRNEFMPDLIDSTRKLMTDPDETYLSGLKQFNQARVQDEELKRRLVQKHGPEFAHSLHGLEDHELLRGRLYAFTLEASSLASRAATFRAITAAKTLPKLGAALLTKGDYSRPIGWRRQFGVLGERGGAVAWRDVLTAGSRETRGALRDALDRLLVDVAGREGTPEEALDAIVQEWLAGREAEGRYDWRYYFVRYPSMLEAPRGIYVGQYDAERGGFRYQLDMMNGGDYRSAFKDPYLFAIWRECDQPQRLSLPEFRSWDYTGTEKTMRLVESGTGLRSLDEGLEVLLPEDPAMAESARATLAPFGVDAVDVIRITQSGPDDLDAEDRIQVGVAVVRALLDAGL